MACFKIKMILIVLKVLSCVKSTNKHIFLHIYDRLSLFVSKFSHYRDSMKILILLSSVYCLSVDFDFDRVFNELSEPKRSLTDRVCMAKFRVPGGGCSIQWSTTEWAEPECISSNDDKFCTLQRVRL